MRYIEKRRIEAAQIKLNDLKRHLRRDADVWLLSAIRTIETDLEAAMANAEPEGPSLELVRQRVIAKQEEAELRYEKA